MLYKFLLGQLQTMQIWDACVAEPLFIKYYAHQLIVLICVSSGQISDCEYVTRFHEFSCLPESSLQIIYLEQLKYLSQRTRHFSKSIPFFTTLFH